MFNASIAEILGDLYFLMSTNCTRPGNKLIKSRGKKEAIIILRKLV
jgi:hypothetical protein